MVNGNGNGNENKNWLNENLIKEVKAIFEPLYKRELSPEEVTEISNNLISLVSTVNKFRWKLKYGNNIPRHQYNIA